MTPSGKQDPMRLCGASFGISILCFGAMFVGGWGPCGPAHPWQFFVFLVGLVALGAAALSLLAAIVLAFLRLVRRRI